MGRKRKIRRLKDRDKVEKRTEKESKEEGNAGKVNERKEKE